MRPVYETREDLTRESAVAGVLEAAWRCRTAKLPRRYIVDFSLHRSGKINAWAEIKTRTCESSAYPNYMLSLEKLLAGMRLERETGLPFLLVVKWRDQTAFCAPSKVAYEISFGGRFDRGDAQDVEPVALIPISEFKKIC